MILPTTIMIFVDLLIAKYFPIALPPTVRAATKLVNKTDKMIWNADPSPCPINFAICKTTIADAVPLTRSEEHTSELQSRFDLVCRLLLEKKNSKIIIGFQITK